MDLQYVVEHGSYVLYDMSEPPSCLTGRREIHLQCDEPALAFDSESGTLHKHGDVAQVTAWTERARAKFRDAGFPEMADGLVVLSGKLPLEDLNKCLSHTGYCKVLLERMKREHLEQSAPDTAGPL